ncbi:hypothetical protein FisN_14Lh366 [Fistulifera solaris]|uniref:Leucine-rich repeat-containing N-terminal plant-type domain-containing protein n=1 Tax=Fistulifera solaris TaxID=1519565 RepID=A0A1Z5JIN3_FISSO|nr:hypothetical protein FisN_14Lh366 [Fistulifera solaris]|eukprot:GAX13621.1 hypothetical protein FisN_14Lh366 [Fistulifera solaris]
MQRVASGDSAISELTNSHTSHRLLSVGDEESLNIESSTDCEESGMIRVSILQPHPGDTSPKLHVFSEDTLGKQHNEKSKVPPPLLMRHTATSTTSFISSPGAMAVRGIGELPHTPSTIACDDDTVEADCAIEVERMATAIAISDKELEDEYRLRILETAVQAKVLKAEDYVSQKLFARMNKMIIAGLLLAAAVVLTVVLWTRSSEESSTSFNGSPSLLSPSYPTVAPTTPFHAQVIEYFRSSEAHDPLQHEIGTSQYQALQAVASMPRLPQTDWLTAYRLMVLYESTQGASWHNNTNWNSDAPLCTWYGVSCQDTTSDASGATNIVGLNLANNRLVGTLPWEITLLPLKIFDLHNNALVDAIPPELSHLSQLTVLDLSNNWLTGSLTTELCANEATLQVDCEHVVCTCCTPDCYGVNISTTMAPLVPSVP